MWEARGQVGASLFLGTSCGDRCLRNSSTAKVHTPFSTTARVHNPYESVSSHNACLFYPPSCAAQLTGVGGTSGWQAICWLLGISVALSLAAVIAASVQLGTFVRMSLPLRVATPQVDDSPMWTTLTRDARCIRNAC